MFSYFYLTPTLFYFFFFFNDTATTEIYTLSLHDALPISSLGGLPMPVDLRLTYASGATENLRLPVEIWYLGNRYTYQRKVPADVVKVEIDPGQNFPDVRRGNNVWTRP